MVIGSMYLGPVYAFVMPVVVSLTEFLTISDTGVYGLIMNFLSSAAYCLVASLIYRHKRKISGAVIALVSASAATVVLMCAANLIITPYYMHVPASEIKALLPTLLLPFNLTKCVVNSSVVMLLYKSFSAALKHAGVNGMEDTNGAQHTFHPVITAVSVLVLIAALVFLFVVLKADIG